jgi:outer membrane protein OmpA-like peptidoglycan-associated protein
VGLAACSSDDDLAGAGSPFTQALQRDYTDLGTQASNLPAAPEAASDEGWLDWLDPFSDSSSPNDLLAQAFNSKAEIASNGAEPEPEAAPDTVAGSVRARLVQALARNKDQVPDVAARAQTDYDCWVLYGNVPTAAAASQACKTSLDNSLVQLEAAGRPAPVPAPMPAPVATAPAPAPVPSDFTVYFDFDSWTLKAEDLTVLTNVISTARTGGQSRIDVVGHTDTSGPNDYNQRLSVHRANVVVEALVDMGARRPAIHASGVGENDLAVETGDGVKEAKNRRTVITLAP